MDSQVLTGSYLNVLKIQNILFGLVIQLLLLSNKRNKLGNVL